MAEVAARTPARDAAERAFERELSDAMLGGPRQPNRTAFVAADTPDLGEVLKRCYLEGRPVMLVYADGRELLIDHDGLLMSMRLHVIRPSRGRLESFLARFMRLR